MLADVQSNLPPPAETRPAAAPGFDQQFDAARALLNAGQLEMALAAYDALLARSPGNVDVLLSRGVVYGRLQRWDKAEADLAAAAAAAPDYADVWSALGNVYLWSGRPAKAADAYTRLVSLRPQDAGARALRERALRETAAQPAPASGLAPAAAIAIAAAPDAFANGGYSWGGSASAGWTDPGAGARWNDQALSVRRYGQQGSIAFETLRAHRFGQEDYAWALDGYTRLWNGAYANLRYQRSPAARLYARNAGRVEIWQSLGSGWEASLSDDVLAFPSTRVNIYGISVAKYIGNYYIALRHQDIVSPGSRSNGDRLLARYYYEGDADNYLELAANRGRSDDAASLVGGRAHSGGAGIAWSRYWNRQWGGRVGATFSRSGDANERAVAASLYRRW